MVNWLFTIILIILCFFIEFLIYISMLLIKALKIYIRKNDGSNSVYTTNATNRKSKAGVIGITIFNIILVLFLIAMPLIQRNNDRYNTENVIYCNHEVDKFIKLLDDNKLEYNIIGNGKIKLQNIQDFEEAVKIAQENTISYSIVSIGH